MTRPVKILIAVIVVAAAILAWFVMRSGGDRVAIDLIDQFPSAKGKQPSAEIFSVTDATLAGETKRAILVKQPSRLTWNVTVPNEAWLKVDLGLLEEAWTMQGDGVLFSIGVSAGSTYDEILSLVVNPFGNASDRGWQALTLDLSQYAGENIDVIFNTRSSPPPDIGRDANADFAVWGAPRIVVR